MPSFDLLIAAFRFPIFKCRSDTDTLLFAENEAAGCAAKALAMLQELDDGDRTGPLLTESIQDLPIIVFRSQGALWEVLLAFRHTWEGQVDATVSQMRKAPALVSTHVLISDDLL